MTLVSCKPKQNKNKATALITAHKCSGHSHGWRHKINRLYWLTQFKDILHNVESKDDLNDYNYKKNPTV